MGGHICSVRSTVERLSMSAAVDMLVVVIVIHRCA
jgi:hypothetical protein